MAAEDPEIKALRKVNEILRDLDSSSQRRVIHYVNERLDARIRIDTTRYLEEFAQSLNYIGDAARRLSNERGMHVSGFDLVNTLVRLYEETENLDRDTMSFAEFDRYMEEGNYTPEQAPEAFAQWLSNRTGKRVTGVATDLSGAVQADPEEGHEQAEDKAGKGT